MARLHAGYWCKIWAIGEDLVQKKASEEWVRVRARARVRLRLRVRVRVRRSLRVRVRVRVRFAFCSLVFSFTQYIHEASFSMWCVCELMLYWEAAGESAAASAAEGLQRRGSVLVCSVCTVDSNADIYAG